MSTFADVPIRKLILVPAVVTLGVTVARLVGELAGGSATFFNREAGGPGALVGIVWLIPVFGVYFALKLAGGGAAPASTGKALGWAALGFAVVPAAGFGAAALGVPDQSFSAFGVFVVASLVGAAIVFRGWPALAWTLLAYGVLARVPVVIVMLFAILGRWGTHYDALPPNFPELGPITTWLLIGLLPQLTFWIWFTIAGGALVGSLATLVLRRGRVPQPA